MNIEIVDGLLRQILAKPKATETHATFLTIGFNTSRELTSEELDRLIVAVQAQIEEPPAASMEERRAGYTTENVTVWHESKVYSV